MQIDRPISQKNIHDLTLRVSSMGCLFTKQRNTPSRSFLSAQSVISGFLDGIHFLNEYGFKIRKRNRLEWVIPLDKDYQNPVK